VLSQEHVQDHFLRFLLEQPPVCHPMGFDVSSFDLCSKCHHQYRHVDGGPYFLVKCTESSWYVAGAEGGRAYEKLADVSHNSTLIICATLSVQ
jgi:hypothetical protein